MNKFMGYQMQNPAGIFNLIALTELKIPMGLVK